MSEMTRRAVGRRRVPDTDRASAAESIFSATARLLDQQSFNDISVAQILTEAEISRATFYFYFGSKFSVLSGLLERAMNDIFETVQPFLARSPADAPTVALQHSIRAVTQAWHRHRSVLQAANHHWHSEPELRSLWLAIAERFIAAGAVEIDRERAAGIITSQVPSRALAATLFWGTERVLYIAGLGVEPSLADEEAAVDALVTMWRGTLYAS
jgi:AcrR family transcriptional regulator